jgi:serine/threonine-protein kinase
VSVSDTSLVGQLLLGRYRVLRRLALGGMGAVYLARTEGARGFSKPVVIKRILPMWGGDEEIMSLFAREARILSQLQDPGIVSVIDFGQITDGTLVMVLDYVHGYHLAHWLSYVRVEQGQMPVEMAVHIVLRVLSALHYAHTFVKADGKPLEVVHRDVSPTNILLDTSGNVKLVDFGIARAAGDNDEYKTEAPQLRGKFGYLPPELFMGEEPTPQSDVYAAGVVLYELLTGDNPFRGREVADSYHKALNVLAPGADTLRSDVTPELGLIIAKALAKQRSERYASAADFADALRVQRPAADEICQARLRSAVQAAFNGPLADTLGLEPLSASDEAWRDAAEGGQSLETALNEPLPALPIDSGPTVPIQRNSQRVPAYRPDGPDVGQLTVRGGQLLHSDLATPGRMRLVVAASLTVIGALVVAGIVRMVEPKEARVIVIEREPTSPSDDTPPARLAAQANLPQPSATTLPNGKAPPAARGTPAHVNAPEPAMLTSSFAHEQPRIQRCFAAHGQQEASAGEITVEFSVDASGEVESAQLSPPSAAAGPLGACLVGVAKTTHFPRLTRAVTFRIPIQARVTE